MDTKRSSRGTVHLTPALLLGVSAALTGCAGQQSEPMLDKSTTGQILGGVAGAAAGTQVGGGSGRTVAIIAGALLGSVVGERIGARMEQDDLQQTAWALEEEFNRRNKMRWLILRYIQLLFAQISQAAVCNRHHSIEQQFCRKLLISVDCLSGNEIALTHGKIADLLGVRREGVTAAAGELRKLDVIDYQRGHITILDRERLEELSCECYAVVKSECERLRPSEFRASTLNSMPWPAADQPANAAAGRINGSGTPATCLN